MCKFVAHMMLAWFGLVVAWFGLVLTLVVQLVVQLVLLLWFVVVPVAWC